MSALLATALVHATFTSAAPTCNSSFTPITASTFIKSMNPGWNLGNTLDAIETEGSWNNPPVVASTFDDVKAAGFAGIRLPVTWAYHFTSQSPDWTVDPVWLQRVSNVVDEVVQKGFYVIVNVHHDSSGWADFTKSGANVTQIEERFYKLWYQIGTKLACKGESVAFEPINEPPGTTAEHGALQNKFNDIFLQAINDAGGHNGQRVVTLVGSGEDSIKTSQWFEPPNPKFKNPWGIQYHYYSPYDFIFSAWGKTTWGSAADVSALDADLASIRANFTDIPLIIGEWSASPVATETAARWRYFDAFIRTAAKYNTSTILWDNGNDYLNRATHEWRDATALSILQHAVKGTVNSLPDSTTDGAATTQRSSAYIYHNVSESLTAKTLPFLFNGNTLVAATLNNPSPAPLVKDRDYTVSANAMTFPVSFLAPLFPSNSSTTDPSPSLPATITLTFSSGAPLTITLLPYSEPVILSPQPGNSTSIPLPGAPSPDLHIPLAWAGQERPAAVKAVKSDGTFLVDDWTQYLGPLQQGRMTFSGQWDWDESGLILRAAVLDAVRAAAQSTKFTVEFYPREPGNAVSFTVIV
ncbi:glycoside hydrolase superfamily [Massariosphaeria phaeospora]|uniref:Glycoside hydrolase superfamily n=1 Tax=Massariosphaeria phaeospora TaxID=100035 RepID=A0A7C8MU11_9PLEO|nr:glycoside hydrolase superfamily [Massariosphaeria phaeospora]